VWRHLKICDTLKTRDYFFFVFEEMRLFNSSCSVLSRSDTHGFNRRCQVAGEYNGCEEACSLTLLKAFKPARLSPEDLLHGEADVLPASSISLGHDRLISSRVQERELFVDHPWTTHKEENSCAISPPVSSLI